MRKFRENPRKGILKVQVLSELSGKESQGQVLKKYCRLGN